MTVGELASFWLAFVIGVVIGFVFVRWLLSNRWC